MIVRVTRWLFLAALLTLPVIKPFEIPLFGYPVQIADWLFLLALILFGCGLVSRRISIRFSNFEGFIFTYVLALGVSTILSLHFYRSAGKLCGELYLFSLAILSSQLINDTALYKRLIISWLIGTALVLVATAIGLSLFYGGFTTPQENMFLSRYGSLPSGAFPRINATFLNANMMCNYLNISSVFVVLASRLKWITKRFAWPLHAGIWVASLCTLSPGIGGVALSSGIWYWCLFRERQKQWLARLALFTAFSVAIFFFAISVVSLDTANTDQDYKIPLVGIVVEPSVRVLVWQSSLDSIRQYPIFGKGVGEDVAFVRYHSLSGEDQILTDAHNVWLSVLGQSGIVGLLAFILVVSYLLRCCIFRANASELGQIRIALSAAFIGAFIYQGLAGSFEDARHLWVLFGLLVGTARLARTDTEEESKILLGHQAI